MQNRTSRSRAWHLAQEHVEQAKYASWQWEAEQRQREFEKKKAAEAEATKERDRQAYRERGWPSG